MQRLPVGFKYELTQDGRECTYDEDAGDKCVILLSVVVKAKAESRTLYAFTADYEGQDLLNDDEFFEFFKEVTGLPKELLELESTCDDSRCPGWGIFDTGRPPWREVERCDLCSRFISDSEAVAYVMNHVIKTDPELLEGIRRKDMLK